MSISISKSLVGLCQQHALSQTLTDWNDLSYDEVISALRQGDGLDEYQDNESIVVWEKFDDEYGDYIADHIESLYIAFEDVVKATLEESAK